MNKVSSIAFLMGNILNNILFKHSCLYIYIKNQFIFIRNEKEKDYYQLIGLFILYHFSVIKLQYPLTHSPFIGSCDRRMEIYQISFILMLIRTLRPFLHSLKSYFESYYETSSIEFRSTLSKVYNIT